MNAIACECINVRQVPGPAECVRCYFQISSVLSILCHNQEHLVQYAFHKSVHAFYIETLGV